MKVKKQQPDVNDQLSTTNTISFSNLAKRIWYNGHKVTKHDKSMTYIILGHGYGHIVIWLDRIL